MLKNLKRLGISNISFIFVLNLKVRIMKYLYLILAILVSTISYSQVDGQKESNKKRNSLRTTDATYNKHHYTKTKKDTTSTAVVGYDINGEYYLTRVVHKTKGLVTVKDYGRYSIVIHKNTYYLVDKKNDTAIIMTDAMKTQKLF